MKDKTEMKEHLTGTDDPHLVDGKYSIKDLVDIESLSKILEKFSRSTGFTTGLVSYPDQEVLIGTGWRDICTKFHRSCPESAKFCRRSNIYLTQQLKELKELKVNHCKNGLVDGATPILIGGKHLASLFTGQILFEEPKIEQFRERALTYGYDVETYLDALGEVPIVSEGEFKNALSFLGEMAVLVAELGLKNYEILEKARLLEDEVFERKRAYEELSESEEKYRLLVDNLPSIVYKGYKDWSVEFFDEKIEVLTGHSMEEFNSGKIKWSDLVVTEDIGGARATFIKALKADKSYVREYRIKAKSGFVLWIQERANIVCNDKGEIDYVSGVFFDITKRKQADNVLKESEQRFRAVLEAVPDLMLVLDAEGHYREVFTADSDLLYAPAEQLLDRKIHEVLPPEDAQQIQEIIDRVLAIGELQLYEYKLQTGGMERWFSGRATKFRFQNVDSVLWCARDITQHKMAEDALRESEERHRKLLEASPDPIVVYDMEGRVTYVNPAFVDTFGWSSQELLGKRKEFVPEENWPEMRAAITRMLRGERIQSFETKRLTKDGRILDIQLSSSVFRDRDDNLAGNIVILRDVTVRRRAEDALRKRESELAAQSRHLEEVNAALKVLLKQREEDKADLEERLLTNVKELVLPYVEKLKNSRLGSDQITLVDILESNMQEIVSPFVTKLSSRFLSLTPTEIQVASLIKDGKSSKEIASLIHTSENTVRSHRFHIRSKLGIKNKKVNLRSYLQSLQDQ